ncbi:transcriptional regulator [Rhodoferax lacus]|uniref:Transcriptional regulator n=2 Tax=Rhodoferax lacus TaxID=2184758 RepID=A0A3E1R752_9BURK|nr:transcriptional regulator [Rhodoferax lacus]
MHVHEAPSTETSVYSPVSARSPWVNMDRDHASLSEVMSLIGYRAPGTTLQSSLKFRIRRLRAGQSVFVMGQLFGGLYVVRLGALKSVITHTDGYEHVTSFSNRGDVLGSDGVCDGHYWCEAVALNDCEVIRLPADIIFSSDRSSDDVERMLYWASSREVTREQAAITVMHTAKSEVRVARFILAQSERFAAMGCSASRFTLPMTRRDIGSYLSLTLETVSRAFSTLHQLGIIHVSSRDITICSMDTLRTYEG